MVLIGLWIGFAVGQAGMHPVYGVVNDSRVEEYYQDALAYFEKGKYRSAVIQLKNALQIEPTNINARILLGRAHYRLFNGPAAEKEFRAAMEHGADPARVTILLGRAYLIQGKADALLVDFDWRSAGTGAEGEIQVLRGEAHLQLSQFARALTEFQYAGRSLPDDPRANVGKSRALLGQKKFAEAEKEADAALKLAPKSKEALATKAQIYAALGGMEDAIRFFSNSLSVDSGYFPALLGRLAAYMDLRRYDQALADLDAIRAIAPNHPAIPYFHASILARQGDFSAAKVVLERSPFRGRHVQSAILYGHVLYALNELEQADVTLTPLIASVPNNVGLRQIVGATRIRLDRSNKAIDVLESALELAPNDYTTLTLMGMALMETREFAKAGEMFDKALSNAPPGSHVRLGLAASLIARGQTNRAAAELETALRDDSRAKQETILLVLTLVRDGKADHAEAVAQSFARALPDNPVAVNLLGISQMARKDPDSARASFERALAIDPGFRPATLNLARLDWQLGYDERAEARLTGIVERDATGSVAMMVLSEIAGKRKQSKLQLDWLERARAADRSAIAPRIRLIDLYLAADDTDKAVGIVRELEALGPQSVNGLESLGRAQAVVGELAKAVETYHRLVNITPRSASAYYRLAKAQAALGQAGNAGAALRRAIKLEPSYTPAKIALIELAKRNRWFDEALTIAEGLRESNAESAIPDMMKGDVLMHAGRFVEAERAYNNAFDKEHSPKLLLRLYQSRLSTGKTEAAREGLERWISNRPGDSAIRSILAEAYAANGYTRKAIEQYEIVVAERPDDPNALNNLAWLYQQGEDSRALETAEKAYRLAPDASNVVDTLGWILVQDSKVARGLGLLAKAKRLSRGAPGIRYHLAVALVAAGLPEEARHELEALLKLGRSFAEIQASRLLLRQLSTQ